GALPVPCGPPIVCALTAASRVICQSKSPQLCVRSYFFSDPTATTEIDTLSLHDALPIFHLEPCPRHPHRVRDAVLLVDPVLLGEDRKSTRLNSSHGSISYAVFCLK